MIILDPFLCRARKIIIFYLIKDWIHMLGLILLGYAYSKTPIDIFKLITALAIGALYLAHGYSLNDIFDNQIKIKASRRVALVFSLIALILCLIISSIISFWVLCLVIFGHLNGMLYSTSFLRLKNRLLWDLISNSLSLSPLFLLGYMINHKLTTASVAVFLLFFLYFLPAQLIHQIQDYPSDTINKQKNTFVLLGIKKTISLIYISLSLYIYLTALLWKTGSLNASSSMLSIAFAFTLFIFSKHYLRGKNPNGMVQSKNLKLNLRYLSIIYGIGMFITFYSNF